jgi:hypothetical protein
MSKMRTILLAGIIGFTPYYCDTHSTDRKSSFEQSTYTHSAIFEEPINYDIFHIEEVSQKISTVVGITHYLKADDTFDYRHPL